MRNGDKVTRDLANVRTDRKAPLRPAAERYAPMSSTQRQTWSAKRRESIPQVAPISGHFA